ncbi:MAG TPA: zf-HC2 domain-containing protein [Gemmatimonadaceae bacterium]|nr:zf-HC2 domain-containing protein [Gemmatimonadaceae bacterium]
MKKLDCGSVDCTQVVSQLWDYLDGELTEERMRDIQTHLTACAGCFPHFDFERAFLKALAATRKEDRMPGVLRARIMEKLREAGCEGLTSP